MSARAAFALLVLLAPLAVACAAGAAATVTGTVAYRERIALPPDAVVEVTLADVSRADAPAEILGRQRIEQAGQVPIPFAVEYDPAAVDGRHTYAIQARIEAGGRLLFVTDTVHRVLTGGAPDRIDVLLRRVDTPAERAAAAAPSGAWAVAEVDGQSVPAGLTIQFDEGDKVAGRAGCNRFSGSFTMENGGIAFGPLATTRMACPEERMAVERAFFDALGRVRGFRDSGHGLKLLDESGRPAIVLRRPDTDEE